MNVQTNFPAELLATDGGARANEILRSCVHCGFCNATCPTYQLTGDELDGPRGRIYLIRELLETGENQARATRHLDRCLTCRACETTCPSGVAYGELAEFAREQIGPRRTGMAGKLRNFLQWMVPHASRLRSMARLGRAFRWFVPARLAKNLPSEIGLGVMASSDLARSVLLLNGCAQQVSTAGTNSHFVRLLADHDIGVQTSAAESCCGSLDLHLGDRAAAMIPIRRNVDSFYPLLGSVEAIVSTASGCGVTIKDYGRLLADDPEYAERAAALSEATVDVSEYLLSANLKLEKSHAAEKVAWHSPCTLQHGQQVTGVVETLLQQAGYTLTKVSDAHLCCGSAGTYSILQPHLSEQLKKNKLTALQQGEPDVIATANVGCQTHLYGASEVDVVHWIELLK